MSLSRINNNIAAVNANRNLDGTNLRISKSIERLSSGLRINRAGDDAAGLTVAARLKAQTQGLNRAVANAQDGISLINVAEGALEETTVRLNRLRVLSIQSANTGVNDLAARKALQDEVFQTVDEITRIGNTTQFNTNRLLNGDFKVVSGLKAGQLDAGVSVDASPVASTLESGNAFLNIIKTVNQDHKLVTGDGSGNQQTFSLGITDRTDVAISRGFFAAEGTLGSTASAGADVIFANFFNNVSVGTTDVFVFDGVLADGVSKYNGSLILTAATTHAQLASALNATISAAEAALFGATVPTGYNLTAAFSDGRIQITETNGSQNFSQADLNLTLVSGVDGLVRTKVDGVTRATVDPGGVTGFSNSLLQQGVVGNSVTAITGSTFTSGQFDISVEDVQTAVQRTVKSTIAFTTTNGAVIDRTVSLVGNAGLNGVFESGVYTGYASITAGDTITLIGTNSDGTTFDQVLTVGVDGTDHDDTFASVSGLIRELNSRDFDATGFQRVFNGSIATLAADGTIQLIEETGNNNSQTSFTLVFNVNDSVSGNPVTFSDDSVLIQEGFEEQANFRVNGGPSIRANAGDVITLFGAESTIDGVPTPQVTIRAGAGLVAGTDTFETIAAEFVGRLNGGEAVTFAAGDQDVQFIDGRSLGSGVAKVTTLDFDNILDVTKASGGSDTGTTLILTTTNQSMNFQIGAFSGQSFQISVGDLRSDALGFGRGSGRTISDLDITSFTGANEALDIIDEALDQVNRTRSLLGAATNRLEGTVANLSVSSENLTASESRLRDADIARESTEFTRNQVLLQAGISVLAQANFTSQGFLSLIG